MKDREAESITVEDVEEDINDETVMRFLEFAYTGDYTAPLPDILQLSTDDDTLAEAFAPTGVTGASEEPEPLMAPSQYDTMILGRTSSKKRKKKINPWRDTFGEAPASTPDRELEYFNGPVPAPSVEPSPFETDSSQKLSRRAIWENFCSQACTIERQPWQPPGNNDQREDYTEVFLCHARLYKFSDRYECYDLMTLSLQKLRLTLSRYKFHQERAVAVVALLLYTYKHTMDYTEGKDKLRSLVLDYVACYIKQLMREQTFLDLLEQGGTATGDIARKMVDLID